MPVDINDPAVLAQAQAIAQRDGVPVEFALLQLRGNAPDATPEQYQEFLQAPGPYSKDNLPPDDGVPFNLGPESLNGGLVGAPGSDMGVDPMAGSGNPLLSDGKEGYGHFIDNSFDAGLERAVLKQSNEQAKADQKMADQMNVLGEARQRDIDKSVELGMLPQQGYSNLVEQDPDFVGNRVEQVASPTAEDPDRTVPVTRVHGGKQMKHSPEDMARLGEMGLATDALEGTPAYDYIQATDGEGNQTFVNPTLMGKGEQGVLNPHQMKQLQTRMNRMRDRSGYSDETQYTPYRKMDGSMGLRIDPNSPEVRQKIRDQVADEASRKKLVQARGMLAGVSPTQNMVNAQMLLMGGELPGGISMSEDFRRRAMQQMMPESTKFDIAQAEQKGETRRTKIQGRTDRDVEATRAGAITTAAEVKANADKEIAELQRDAMKIKTDEDRAQAQRNHEEKMEDSRRRERQYIAEGKEREANIERNHQKEMKKLDIVIAQNESEQSRLDEDRAFENEQRQSQMRMAKTKFVDDNFKGPGVLYGDGNYDEALKQYMFTFGMDYENPEEREKAEKEIALIQGKPFRGQAQPSPNAPVPTSAPATGSTAIPGITHIPHIPRTPSTPGMGGVPNMPRKKPYRPGSQSSMGGSLF